MTYDSMTTHHSPQQRLSSHAAPPLACCLAPAHHPLTTCIARTAHTAPSAS
eukprot:SAG25_NODE_13939_length_261_cov_0.629630_1_plen_50_part_10